MVDGNCLGGCNWGDGLTMHLLTHLTLSLSTAQDINAQVNGGLRYKADTWTN